MSSFCCNFLDLWSRLVDVPGTIFNNPAIIQARPLHTLPGFFENGPKNNFSDKDSWKSSHGFNFSITPFLRTSIFIEDDNKFVSKSPLNKNFIEVSKEKALNYFVGEHERLSSIFDTFFRITSEFHSLGAVFSVQKTFQGFRVLFALPFSLNVTHPFLQNISSSNLAKVKEIFADLKEEFSGTAEKTPGERNLLENDGIDIINQLRQINTKMVSGAYACIDFPVARADKFELDLSPCIYLPFNNKSLSDWKYLNPERQYLSSKSFGPGEESEMFDKYFEFLNNLFTRVVAQMGSSDSAAGLEFFSHLAAMAQSIAVSRLVGPISQENLSLGCGAKLKYKVNESETIRLFNEFKVNYEPEHRVDWLIFSKNIYEPSLTKCTLEGKFAINNRVGVIMGQNGVSLKLGYDFYKTWAAGVKYVFNSYNSSLMQDLGSDSNLSKTLSTLEGVRAHKMFSELNWNLGGSKIHAMASLGLHCSIFSKNTYDDVGLTLNFKFEY